MFSIGSVRLAMISLMVTCDGKLLMYIDPFSNVLIGTIICLVSFFYLLQSETITDVVLNSFALTFIIELDDMANLFESDENVLLENIFKLKKQMIDKNIDNFKMLFFEFFMLISFF